MPNQATHVTFGVGEEGAVYSTAPAQRQTDNEYLHRIHFWVRFWSVLSIVMTVLAIGGMILVSGLRSHTENSFSRTNYCLTYPSSSLCD